MRVPLVYLPCCPVPNCLGKQGELSGNSLPNLKNSSFCLPVNVVFTNLGMNQQASIVSCLKQCNKPPCRINRFPSFPCYKLRWACPEAIRLSFFPWPSKVSGDTDGKMTPQPATQCKCAQRVRGKGREGLPEFDHENAGRALRFDLLNGFLFVAVEWAIFSGSLPLLSQLSLLHNNELT